MLRLSPKSVILVTLLLLFCLTLVSGLNARASGQTEGLSTDISPKQSIYPREVQFNGSYSGEEPALRYVWTSDLDGELHNSSESANFTTDSLSLGHHKISFQVENASGWSDKIMERHLVSRNYNLLFSTFVGGTGEEQGNSIVRDGDGNIFVCGETTSSEFPVTEGAYNESHSGETDIFVFKLNPNGSTLLASTLLGGSGADSAQDIILGPDGTVYITGETSSSDFPTTAGAFNRSYGGGSDAFLVGLSVDLTTLEYASFLGGSGDESEICLAVDEDGTLYIGGTTSSPNLPTSPGCFSDTLDRGGDDHPDAFVMKLDPAGSGEGDLLYSSFVGGERSDMLEDLALDQEGKLYLVGSTTSTDLSVTSGALNEEADPASRDLFFVKMELAGGGSADLLYGSYLGGTDEEKAGALALDGSGNVYITGYTFSTNFPVTSGSYDESYNNWSGEEPYDDRNAFVLKIDPSGNGAKDLVFGSYLGGELIDTANALAVDSEGNIFVAGRTASNDFPTAGSSYDNTGNGGDYDAFLAKLDPTGSQLLYSSFLGSSGQEEVFGLTLDKAGNLYLVGETNSSNYPTTKSAYDSSYNDDTSKTDIFVTVLNLTQEPVAAMESFYPTTGWVHEDMLLNGSGNGEYAIIGYHWYSHIDGFLGDTARLTINTLSPGQHKISFRVRDSAGTWSREVTEDLIVKGPEAFIDSITENPTVIGRNNQFIGHGTGKYPLVEYAWESSLDGELSDQSTFSSKGLSEGLHILSFRVKDENGVWSDNFTVQFRVNGIPDILKYSSFLGGHEGDTHITDIAFDTAGCLYLTGYTWSPTFRYSEGAYDTTLDESGYNDSFVVKVGPDGTTVIFATFLGGSHNDWARSIEVDSTGNIYVAGGTRSEDFPTTSGAYQEDYAGGLQDSFVVKLKFDGSGLIYSTLVGGMGKDVANQLLVDAQHNVLLTGYTYSTNYPITANANTPSPLGNGDIFLTRLNSLGTQLLYSTTLGGSEGLDSAEAMAFGPEQGSVFITGYSKSASFPTTKDAYSGEHKGDKEVFVLELFYGEDDVEGADDLRLSTLVGGAGADTAFGIALDQDGNIYVGGETNSANFPVSQNAYQTSFSGVTDAFAFKLDPTATTLLNSTFIGGSMGDSAYDLKLGPNNEILLVGRTDSSDFPVSARGYAHIFGGSAGSDAFVCKMDTAATTMLYSSFIGGENSDFATCLEVDSEGVVYLAGDTRSEEFPVTPNALDACLDSGSLWSGLFMKMELVLRPNNKAPTVTVTNKPAVIDRGDIITITGAASDEDGVVNMVELSIDGGEWVVASGTHEWSFIWHSGGSKEGERILKVRAVDNEGDTSEEVSFTVTLNQAKPPEPPKEEEDEANNFVEKHCMSSLAALLCLPLAVVSSTRKLKQGREGKGYQEPYKPQAGRKT